MRLDCPNQNGFSLSCGPADGIDAKMVPVNKIDIRESRRAIHDAVAGGLSCEAVAGGVAHEVGFGFDNRSAAIPVRCASDQPMSQQPGRDNFRRRRIERTGQRNEFHDFGKMLNAAPEMKDKKFPIIASSIPVELQNG